MLRRNVIFVAENNLGAVASINSATSPAVTSKPGISGDSRTTLEHRCIVSRLRTQAPQTILSCHAAADFLVGTTRRCGVCWRLAGDVGRWVLERAGSGAFCGRA